MNESVVSIDIHGTTIRHTTVVRGGDAPPQLVDLGREDFAFDVAHDLLRADTLAHREAIHDALHASIAQTQVHAFRVVVHPTDAYAFFTPLSVDASVSRRKRELRQRTALLTQIRDIDSVTLHAKTVRTADDPKSNERLMWVHVMAVPSAIEERMQALSSALQLPPPQWTVSTEAAIPVVSRIELSNISHKDALRPYTLSIGAYASHTEYALSYDRTWHHGHVAVDADTTDDRAYYAVSMLNRLQVPVDSVGRLFLYGTTPEEQPEVLASIFDRAPAPIRLSRALDTSTCDLKDDPATDAAFVPCVGAALSA